MLLLGKLDKHLAEMNQTTNERFDRIVEQLRTVEGVTEELSRTAGARIEVTKFCIRSVQKLMKDREAAIIQSEIGQLRMTHRRFGKKCICMRS